jgi:hypothetical protein
VAYAPNRTRIESLLRQKLSNRKDQAAVKLRAMSIRAPIILFTMYAEAMQPFDALPAGVNAVVSKSDLTSLQWHVESLLVTA